MPSFDLNRFVTAQFDTYETALAEAGAGKKRTHWMWFVFPQISGLGSSEMAKRYAIENVEEAKAYLAHPVLGSRLIEITEVMNARVGNNPTEILGAIDAVKFRSSMTLFNHVAPEHACFSHAIEKFFGGRVDEETLRRVALS